MAYALCDRHGNATAVSFDANGMDNSEDVIIREISDQIAREILEGSRALAYCFIDPPEVTQAPEPNWFAQHYTHRYPAMMPDIDVDTLISLCARIPAGGVAVEIGSRFGGSAKLICDNTVDLKRLYCIDVMWEQRCDVDVQIRDILTRFDIDGSRTCMDYATELLEPHRKKVRLLAAHSPYDLDWWTEPIDFIFEDSSHANPQLRDNLDFWWSHLKPGGLLVGHDFSQYWPDVLSVIPAFAAEKGLDFQNQGTVWWISKP